MLVCNGQQSVFLLKNDPLFSPNRSHWLSVGEDGNLVAYAEGAHPMPIWQSGSIYQDVDHYFAALQTDCNFVVYYGEPGAGGAIPLWATNTSRAIGRSYLDLTNDGNLILYTGYPDHPDEKIWTSFAG